MSKNDINNKNKNSIKNVKSPKGNMKSIEHSISREQYKINYLHIPIFLVIGILPLIVLLKVYDPNMSQFPWFSDQTTYDDLFLYYKQNFLIMLSIIMVIVALYKTYKERHSLKILPIFIPLAIYAFLAFLSAVFSKYSYFSYHGSLDQFESVFALLGYCIIVYYVYLNINTENEIKVFIHILICGALVMSFIGVSQFIGHDFFNSELGYRLIMPVEYRNSSGLVANFGSKRVYMTLFNPNYVGVYVSMITPIIFILLFFQKRVIWIVLSIISIIGLLICEFGSQSLAGFIGLGAGIFMILVFLRRYIFKKPVITISAIAVLLIGIILLNVVTDNLLIDKMKSAFQLSKTVHSLSNLETLDDGISITFKGTEIKVKFLLDEGNIMKFEVVDKDNNTVPITFDPVANNYKFEDQQLSEIVLGFDMAQQGIFYIQIEGEQYRFTNLTEDRKYYYVNPLNKLDKLKTAPSLFFRGYESFASGRGYIWSRTLPLIKDYIILGSGPDTFTMVFPQNDYVNASYWGYAGQIMTKPHNLYLQISVQTGLLSLIAFLTFYGIYFVTSIRLYFKGIFDSYYSKVGVAIFIGTVAYMVTGLTNDSSITVAPVFWTLMGIGIVINYKVEILKKKEVIATKTIK